MVGVVIATLLVAGLATVGLGRANARDSTERGLRAQAANIQQLATVGARSLGVDGRLVPRLREARGVLGQDPCNVALLRRVLQVQATACAVVGPDGVLTVAGGDPPAGLPRQVDVDALAKGRVLSGTRGGVSWAAAALAPGRAGDLGEDGLLVALLTRPVTSPVSAVRGWLLGAAGAAVALGVLVAAVLGRRLARPVAAAEVAAARLAAGDLAVRLPEPPPGQEGDELGRLARSINALAASLEHSRAAEQRFLLSISHDLRTPLTSIRGYAEALADGTLTDVDQGAAVIRQEAARLERLVRDLLDLARLESRQFRIEPEVVDLAEVARSAAEAAAAGAQARGVAVGFGRGAAAGRSPEAVAPKVTVVGDRDRLGQVAANLVENATKFARSQVVVSAGEDASGAWLAVADDGPGIAAEDLPHVFDRLYVGRSRPTREEAGSGLGLAIVRELVSLHGGTVHAEAAEGGGTVVVVRLPGAAPPTR